MRLRRLGSGVQFLSLQLGSLGVVTMKRLVIAISLVMVIFAIASLMPGRAQEARQASGNAVAPQAADNNAPPTHNWAAGNPLKIALLKWYQANRVTKFKVGSQPYGVCFEGANIWTANFGETTVTKLRANDGEVLGTFQVGAAPYGDFRRGQHLGVEPGRRDGHQVVGERWHQLRHVPGGPRTRVDGLRRSPHLGYDCSESGQWQCEQAASQRRQDFGHLHRRRCAGSSRL